jgi:hypothetical protein
MAAALREEGVAISGLVREALRAEYQRRFGGRGRSGRKPSELVERILDDLPDPRGVAARGFALSDRRAVSDHIRAKLTRGAAHGSGRPLG